MKKINKNKLAWIITYSIQAVLFVISMIFACDTLKILTVNDLSAIAGVVILPITMILMAVCLVYSIVCLIIHLIKHQKILTWVQLIYLLIEIALVITFMILLMV